MRRSQVSFSQCLVISISKPGVLKLILHKIIPRGNVPLRKTLKEFPTDRPGKHYLPLLTESWYSKTEISLTLIKNGHKPHNICTFFSITIGTSIFTNN